MAYRSNLAQREYAKRHYERNKATYKRRAAAFTTEAIKRNKALVRSYLLAHPCVDCGESDPVVLDFDHVKGGKVKEVSTMVRDGMSAANIRAEIAKCEVRCANCHRRMTHRRRQNRTAATAARVAALLFE